MKKILVVDDEENICSLMQDILGDEYEVFTAPNGKEGLEVYYDKRPSVVITDIIMPQMNGIELLARIREHSHEIPVIVMTGFMGTEDALAVSQLKVWDFIRKPLDFCNLRERIDEAYKYYDNWKGLREVSNESSLRSESAVC